jgi:PhzF family phenazine biosynthesis protein
MQRTAREFNLSETVFALPAVNGGDARVRIFTPSAELPFAGHPVLGATRPERDGRRLQLYVDFAGEDSASRLAVTPQYREPWVRQIENMSLAVPFEKARHFSQRVRELLGYSIHRPFIGYVDGMHPRRLLDQTEAT